MKIKNWKTTGSAAISVAAGFIALNAEAFPPSWHWVVRGSQYISLGGVGLLGLNAVDARKGGKIAALDQEGR
jgi:hypothetical protein